MCGGSWIGVVRCGTGFASNNCCVGYFPEDGVALLSEDVVLICGMDCRGCLREGVLNCHWSVLCTDWTAPHANARLRSRRKLIARYVLHEEEFILLLGINPLHEFCTGTLERLERHSAYIYTMLGIYLPSATCLMGGSVLSVLVLLSRAGFPRLLVDMPWVRFPIVAKPFFFFFILRTIF